MCDTAAIATVQVVRHCPPLVLCSKAWSVLRQF